MRIALAGNPNSGKTTMYNALCGKNEKVGNWAGVTVDKKEALLKSIYNNTNEEVVIVDLPGAYSISAYTSEESVTSEYIKSKDIDVIINIVDASNLSRALFFTTQLLELNIPLVIALNKSDLNEKKQTTINEKLLANKLNCSAVKTISTSNTNNGFKELINEAIRIKGSRFKRSFNIENDDQRYQLVEKVLKEVENKKISDNTINIGDKIDNIITNKWIGIPLFAIVMWLVFDISQSTLGPLLADTLVNYIETFQEYVRELVSGASPFLQALLVDGIIGGVGAVVGFLPLVMVMYFLIALLEDCGYMARVSVVMDPIFKKVGLSGKSIIPMIIGTGCSIPGVMACRTIRDENERRATAMLTPFMPCGAKLPVIALFSGVFFANASWVGTLMYFVGIAIIFLGALLIKKISGAKLQSYFIIELPEYKIPSLKIAIKAMFSRAKDYIVKAGTIILVCNAAVQLMQTFTWNLTLVEEGMESTSILASIASPFALILIPLGFGVWQLAAASITGFIAKENVVGTLAVVYGMTSLIDVDDFVLIGSGNEVANIMGLTKVAALAYLMFNLFTPPCFAAIGAMNSEIKDKKWLFGGVALQFAVGYTLAFIVYQFGTLITTGSLGDGFIAGAIIVSAIVIIIAYLINKKSRDTALKLAASKGV